MQGGEQQNIVEKSKILIPTPGIIYIIHNNRYIYFYHNSII
jgi:hypothetical protein